jgi:L-threonylcarbamoyladenylate synthase
MSAFRIRHAARILKQGGVIAYPTEAVFGLGCDPRNPAAVDKLLQLKQRSWRKGLILIAANFSQVADFIEPLDEYLQNQIFTQQTKPITWLLPACSTTPRYLRGTHSSLAIRITSHAQTIDLCNKFGGAIVSTSANPSHSPPAKKLLTVRKYFQNRLDCMLSGATDGFSSPSEIRDPRANRILRL